MGRFVEKTFIPPAEAEFEGYVLHPLGPDDVEADCAAANENADLIRQTRGGTWPRGPITLDEDLGDLREHQRQFRTREAFAYVISNTENGMYEGCLYIYPPHHPFDDTDQSAMPADADAAISFWVVRSAYNAGLYQDLFTFVGRWLNEVWPFMRPCITNAEKPAE